MDLAQVRGARRLRELGERCTEVDDCARRMISRLFQAGTIFTRQGARLGRDLLLSHQQLLRAAALVGRAEEHDAELAEETDALYREACALVERSTEIVARCEASCPRGR